MAEVISGWITREQVNAVTALLTELADEGWSIGTAQIIATHNLLLAVQADPHRELTTAQLAEWIGPVVCKSQKQQAEFPARLSMALHDLAPEMDSPPLPPRERRLHLAILLTLIAVVVLGAAAWVYVRMNPPIETGLTGTTTVVAPSEGGTATIGLPGDKPKPRIPVAVPGSHTQKKAPITLIAFAATGVILMGVAVWFVTRARREHRLRKVFASDESVRDYYPSVGSAPLVDLEFRRAAQVMRRRYHEPGTEVDVQATIAATASRAGAFSPVFAPRTRTPEYLVLIDQATTRDIQATLFENVTRRLLAYGVAVDLFFFDGDPRICWQPGRNTERFRFETIAASYARHNLMIFTAGERFADRLTDRPARWVHSFFSWFRDPVIFTPRPVMQWDAMEWMLARCGALVLPASGAGIAAYVARGERAPQVSFNARGSLVPHLLEEDDEMWIAHAEPPRELVRQLVRDLELAVGPDAMTWLAACAVYPGVDWAVLLYLGKELKIPNFEDNLLALARLPWFRHGYLPDWLRMRLLWTLDKPVEKSVRAALFAMFDQAVFHKSGGNVRLSHYRDLAHALGTGHQLSEHVIVDFMSDRKVTPLHLSIPQRFALRVEEYLERYARRTSQQLRPQWAALLLAYVPFAGIVLARSKDEEVRWHARMGTLSWLMSGLLAGVAYLATVQMVQRDSYFGSYGSREPLIDLEFSTVWVLLLMPWLPVVAISARRAAYGNRMGIPILARAADAPENTFFKVPPYSLLIGDARHPWRDWIFLAGVVLILLLGWRNSALAGEVIFWSFAWLYLVRIVSSWKVEEAALAMPARLLLALAIGSLFAATEIPSPRVILFYLCVIPPLLIGTLLGDVLKNRRRLATFGMAVGGLGVVVMALAPELGETGAIILLTGAICAWPNLVTIFGRSAAEGLVTAEVRRAVTMTAVWFAFGFVGTTLLPGTSSKWPFLIAAEVALIALAYRVAAPRKPTATVVSNRLFVWSSMLVLAAAGLTEWLRGSITSGDENLALIPAVMCLATAIIYRRTSTAARVAFLATVAGIAIGVVEPYSEAFQLAFWVCVVALTSAAWLVVQTAPFRWRATTAAMVSSFPLLMLIDPLADRRFIERGFTATVVTVLTATTLAVLATVAARKTSEEVQEPAG